MSKKRDLGNRNSEELSAKKIRGDNLSNEELLIQAAKEGDIKQVQFLTNAGVEVNYIDCTSQTTALHVATKEGHKDLVEELLALGANITLKDQEDRNALHYAVKYSRAEIANSLIKWSIKNNIKGYVDGEGSDSITPLLLVDDNIDVARVLLQHNANINLNCGDCGTALHMAAAFNNNRMIKFLLESKADIEALSTDEQTPLQVAAESGSNDGLILLLKYGANVHTKDNCGKTPLHNAAQHDKARALKILLEYGADIEAKDEENQTPSHYAANHSLESMKALFEMGANFGAIDNEGITPLQDCLKNYDATTIANTMIQLIVEAHTRTSIELSMNQIFELSILGLTSLLKSGLPDHLKSSALETLVTKLHDFYVNDATKKTMPELWGELGTSVISHYINDLIEAAKKDVEYDRLSKLSAENENDTSDYSTPNHIKSLCALSLEQILPQMKALTLAEMVNNNQNNTTLAYVDSVSEITSTENGANHSSGAHDNLNDESLQNSSVGVLGADSDIA